MLVRLDINDTTKVVGGIADSWTVSDDGLTYTFKLKPGLKFASGNPITAEDVAWSFERAVKLDKSPAFILQQFGLTGDNVAEKAKAADDSHLRLHRRQGLCAELRAQLPDRDRRRGGRQQAGQGACRGRHAQRRLQVRQRFRQWLAEDQLCRLRPVQDCANGAPTKSVVLERNDNYYGDQASARPRHLSPRQGKRHPAPDAGEGRHRRRPQPASRAISRPSRKNADLDHHQRAEGHGLLHQPQPEEREPGQAGSARGVQVSGRLRRDRRDAASRASARSTRPSCRRAFSARSTTSPTSSTSPRPRNCWPRPACRTASPSPWTCATVSR